MELGFGKAPAGFESPSQIARVLTEGWVALRMFCPGCGADQLEKFANNREAADFHCARCGEEYELKSQKGRFGPSVVDGAYAAMLRRLQSANNPSLLLMNYDLQRLAVTNLFVVPRHFFTPEIIEARPPLGRHRPARRLARLQHPFARGPRVGEDRAGPRRRAHPARRGARPMAPHPVSARGAPRGARLAGRGDEVRRGHRPRPVHPRRRLRLRAPPRRRLSGQPQRPPQDQAAAPGPARPRLARVPRRRGVPPER